MNRISQRSLWLLAVVVHCLGYSAMPAQWSEDFLQWKHRTPITLSNPNGEIKNYFLLLRIDTKGAVSGSRMRADGNDIRITDSAGKGLKYWIQDGVGTSATNIWVKMPSIPAGNSTIYMYYGNPTADAPSSATDVFGRRLVTLYTFTEGKDNTLHDWVGGIDLRLENPLWGSGFRDGVWALRDFINGKAYSDNLGSGPQLGNGSFTVVAGVLPLPDRMGGKTQADIVGNFHGDLQQPGWILTFDQGGVGDPSLSLVTHDVQFNTCKGEPAGAFPLATWALATGKRDAGVGKTVYHDGAPVGETCPGDARDVSGNADIFGIGNANGVNPFPGYISFVAIYDTAYGDAAIADLHKAIVPDTEPSVTTGSEETLPPAVITQQPVSVKPCLGTSATLSVVATGQQLRYQWRKNGKDIPGATGSTYTIPSITFADNGTYDVVVRYHTISAPVQITVLTPPGIETHPTNQSICPGTSATFSVSATGQGLTYQWRKNGIAIQGATSPSYTIAAASSNDAGTYDVVVNGPCNPPATSAPAVLMIYATPTITEHPVSKSACRGDIVTFSVAATGTNVTYQWRRNGTPIKGATGPQTTVSVDWKTQGTYDVVVGGRCQPEATSNTAQLTILSEPIIMEDPISQLAKPGGSVVFSVKATGGGTLSYQWYKNGLDMPGRIHDTLMLNNISTGDIADYNVVVRGTDCPQKLTPSASAQLYLDVPPAIVTEPQSITVCQGRTATLSVTAAGLGLTYKWRKEGLIIPGAVSRTLTLANVAPTDGGSYDVVITSPTGQTLTSGTATVTVIPAATIDTQPADVTVCPGRPATLTVGATGSGLTYQWRRNGVNIAGATGSTFSIAATTEAESGTYSVVVRDTCANTITSSSAQVHLDEPPVITQQPTGTTAAHGQSVVFTVKATGTSLTYQWRKDGADIPGATSSSYTITNVQPQQAGSYDVVVTGACDPAAVSTRATLTVMTSSVSMLDPVSPGAMLSVIPHPAHGTTSLMVTLPRGIHAGNGSELLLYDMHGNMVLSLSESFAQNGYRTAEFDASVLASGVYYCRLSTQSWNGTLGSIVVEK